MLVVLGVHVRGVGALNVNTFCRHSAARSRRRPNVVDSARLNQLNSSWTFTRARESAPPYGKWSSRLARWFDARVIRVVKTIIIFQRSFSDRFVSAPACCCVRILAFAERTRALEVDSLRLLVIWQRCDHVKRRGAVSLANASRRLSTRVGRSLLIKMFS